VASSALLDQLTLGDHVCWIDDDAATRLDMVAGAVRAGLRERDRVLYCGDDPADALSGIERRGVRTFDALASGSLRASTAESSYLTAGAFDPAAAVRFLREEQDRARHDGYPGLRVIADMAWASRPMRSAEHLPRHEARINALFTEGYLLGICAYDRRLFDPLSLRQLSWAHPAAAGPRVPFDPASALRMRRTREPYGLRLAGEADRFNRQALSAVIESLLDDLPDDDTLVKIDVSELRFADTAAARILIHAADRAAGRFRLVGHSQTLIRLLEFHGARQVPDLTA